jgi:N-acetyltransferase
MRIVNKGYVFEVSKMLKTSDLTLEGNQVQLAPLKKEHAESLLKAASIDRTTYAFTPVPQDLASMNAYINAALNDQIENKALPFVMIHLQTQQIVGTTRIYNLEFWKWPDSEHPLQRRDATPDAVEIGWTWITGSYQRTAVNTEAKLLMLTHAFETWKVHRVALKTDARNERSRRAIERLGARLDGVLRSHMPSYDGQIRDSAYYSILQSEWELIKNKLVQRLKVNP